MIEVLELLEEIKEKLEEIDEKIENFMGFFELSEEELEER
jgi:tetrahydromethanopterin S-methyltransferase subunit G